MLPYMNLTIRSKLLFLGGAILFLVSFLVFSGWQGFLLIQQKMKNVHALDLETAHLQTVIRGLSEVALTEGTLPARNLAAEAVGKFEKTLADLLVDVRSEEIRRQLLRIRQEWEGVRQTVAAFLAQKDVSPYDADSMVLYGKVSAELEDLLKLVSNAARDERAYASSVVQRTLLLIGLLAVGILAVTGLLLLSTYRSIARPIQEMLALARRTADGDLTCGFDLHRRDEIGALAAAFGGMRENLKGMIVRIRAVAADISAVSIAGSQTSARAAAAVEAQKEVIARTDGSIRQMDESFRSMTESAQRLLRSSESAAATVGAMTDSIGDVVRDAGTFREIQNAAAQSVVEMIAAIGEGGESIGLLVDASEETVRVLTEIDASVQAVQEKAVESVRLAEEVSREAAERGLPSIIAAVEGMKEVRDSVGSLTESILALDRRSGEIGRILSVIDEVADQTQLLSLNAAIIAAQAGERGRGFRVVAEEIKNLAQKTSVSTREVTELILSIQEQAQASAARSKAGLAAVERGLPLVQEASRAFQSIHASSRSSTGMSRAIGEMTSEQARGIHEVTLGIQKMAARIRRLSSSSQSQGEEGRRILDAVESMKSASERVIEAMAGQAAGSRKISQVSDEVALQAQEIGSDLSGQRERSAAIVSSAESLRQTSADLSSTTFTLDRAVAVLREHVQTLDQEMRKFTLE